MKMTIVFLVCAPEKIDVAKSVKIMQIRSFNTNNNFCL